MRGKESERREGGKESERSALSLSPAYLGSPRPAAAAATDPHTGTRGARKGERERQREKACAAVVWQSVLAAFFALEQQFLEFLFR